MRITWRLTLSLLLAAIIVAFISAFVRETVEKNQEKAASLEQSRLLTESLQQVLKPTLNKSSDEIFQATIKQFIDRPYLSAIAVYDSSLKTVKSTLSLSEGMESAGAALAKLSSSEKREKEAQIQLDDKSISIIAVPLRTNRDQCEVVVFFHDTTAAHKDAQRIWTYRLPRILAHSILVVLLTLLIIRWNIFKPLEKISDWMMRFRRGEAIDGKILPRDAIFNPLTKEVTTFARQLNYAKAAAEQEARLRQASDSTWTPERLKEHIKSKLDGRSLVVVSNREPYRHVLKGRQVEVEVPASGVVTALDPVMQAGGGTWVAAGETETDWTVLDENDCVSVPPDQPRYTLRRVRLTKEEEQGFYYGFCNEGIWPLCHIAHVQPIFRPDDWQSYQEANQKFADATLAVIADQPEPCILIQDFHFALLPRLLKQARPDARIAIFWHIPWTNPEAFRICPWQKELLDGMLGADLIGFHTQYHCNHFLETAEQALECRVDWELFSIERQQHTTKVKAFPISVAYPQAEDVVERGPAVEKSQFLRNTYGIKSTYIGLGVERVDYTKGILQRFHAIERFFEKYPEFVSHFTFVQVGAPSRTHLHQYSAFFSHVEAEAMRINNRLKTNNWKPIVFLNRHHSQKEIVPLYKNADVCMVTSLHDGMNLVAKEFIAARDDDSGVLILSQFTGASRELKDALIINPYDMDQLADAIYKALIMDSTEKQQRMRSMRLAVSENNIYRWAAVLIEELTRVRINGEVAPITNDF